MANKRKKPKKSTGRKPGAPPRKIDRDKLAEYDYHLPVMLGETLEFLDINEKGIYVDGTLGGGGHTHEIIQRLGTGGHVHAFDKDKAAIDHCQERFSDELAKGDQSRLIIHRMSYKEACSIKEVRGKVQGILLDLGVSSRQLDDLTRGFSHRGNADLDMRFGSDGQTAEDIVQSASEDELVRIFRSYGEDPYAKAIARRICEKRRAIPLKTTFDLRTLVEESVPKGQVIKSMSRIFQALRIAVNDELKTLEETLLQSPELLAPQGRLVILSYHSLEDRIVKNIFKELSRKRVSNDNNQLSNNVPVLKILTNKPLLPDYDETIRNPRARSAKLRVAERV
jgi:16S rRNA (cytosine1402-N4)-methyltransferase